MEGVKRVREMLFPFPETIDPLPDFKSIRSVDLVPWPDTAFGCKAFEHPRPAARGLTDAACRPQRGGRHRGYPSAGFRAWTPSVAPKSRRLSRGWWGGGAISAFVQAGHGRLRRRRRASALDNSLPVTTWRRSDGLGLGKALVIPRSRPTGEPYDWLQVCFRRCRGVICREKSSHIEIFGVLRERFLAHAQKEAASQLGSSRVRTRSVLTLFGNRFII